MVYNTTRHIKMPFSNGVMTPHLRRLKLGHKIEGEGTGSVLLRNAGGGAGSSYMDMDDYIRTTGLNPATRRGTQRVKGMEGNGMSKLGSKLARLNIQKPTMEAKRKNITMSF
jgi:hypothetical protein